MLSKEVIQAFINDVNEKQNSVIYQTSMANAQWLKETLIEVLQYIEELNKGQHSLIQSRKKWKNRYYKERSKGKEVIEDLKEVRHNLEKDGFVGYADEIEDIIQFAEGE